MDSKILNSTLNKIGARYISLLRKKLKQDGNYVTGATSRSIKKDVRTKTLTITSDDQLIAISEGKKATSKKPSSQMVTRISRWIMKKNPTLRTPKGRFAKRKSGTNLSMKRKIAYGVASKINRSTWKGSKVIDRTYNDLEASIEADILEVYKVEIDKAIDNLKTK